jgi:hypothetical protein
VLFNSTFFNDAVHAANFSAFDLFSGMLTTEDDNHIRPGLEIVHAGAAYARMQHASSEAPDAYVKLVTCPVSINGPLAVLVAAHNPSRGFSTVHVSTIDIQDGCVGDAPRQSLSGVAGNHIPHKKALHESTPNERFKMSHILRPDWWCELRNRHRFRSNACIRPCTLIAPTL